MSNSNKAFTYSYSGAVNDELKEIKKKYSMEEPAKKLRRIRKLDKRVDFVSTMISIALGMIFTTVLVRGGIIAYSNQAITSSEIIQIVFGILGSSVVPFVHSKVYKLAKKHYGTEILSLVEEIEQNRT